MGGGGCWKLRMGWWLRVGKGGAKSSRTNNKQIMYNLHKHTKKSQLCVFTDSVDYGGVCVHETRDKQLNRATGR